MKIALVTDTYPPDVNGVSFTLERLAHGLVTRGHEVEIFRPQPAPNDQGLNTSGPPQHILRSLPVPGYPALRMGWPSYFKLKTRWETWRPDVAYVATEGLLGFAAVQLARNLNIAVGSGYHTNFCDYLPSYGGRCLVGMAGGLQRWLHNRCAFTAAPSRDTVSQLRAEGYERVMLVRRGVDSVRFSPAKYHPQLRLSWGAQPGDLVVLLVGRVAAEKNLPLALDALEQLRETFPHVKPVVVGDGPVLEICRARYPFVHFAGEHRGEALAEHYASGDLLLFPSLTETFGNVLLEAMASGLPTLSFDYAAGREHIIDGENGWTVPYGQSQAFTEKIRELLQTSPFLLDSVGSAARRSTLELTWDSIIGRFESLLEAAHQGLCHQTSESSLSLISSSTRHPT